MRFRLNEAQKKMLRRTGITILSLFMIFYVVYNVTRTGIDSIQTVTAFEKTVSRSVRGKGYFVRNESLILSAEGGVVIPMAVDGKKVSKGDIVAMAFNSEEGAAAYSRLVKLEQERERYEKLSMVSPSSSIDTASLDLNINDSIDEVTSAVAAGDYSLAETLLSDFRDLLTKKQLVLGESIDFVTLIDEATKEIAALTAKGTAARTVTATDSGYFIGNADGCEDCFEYSEIADITTQQIDELFKYTPKAVSAGVMGKLVTNFNWYIVCNSSAADAAELNVGDTVTVSFPYASTTPVKGFVHALNNDGAGNIAVVIRSNVMNEELAGIRQAEIEIVYDKATGFAIPPEAVREAEVKVKDEDGVERTEKQKGVYILRSNMVTFRKINIIYTGEDYVLCAPSSFTLPGDAQPTMLDNDIKLYDRIIIKGKDLYDGKTVY